MENENTALDEFKPNDQALWKRAEKRAKFKRHATIYALVIGFFWLAKSLGLLWFTPGLGWMTIIWGAVVVYQYWQTYHDDYETNVQKEYEKLKKDANNL